MQFVRDNSERSPRPRKGVLRLADASDEVEDGRRGVRSPEVVAARRAVAMENHLSGTMRDLAAYDDLARGVADSLHGGKAALLPPEARRRLVAGAVRSGLRPFEAHLVVAAVQDAARHGEVASRATATPVQQAAAAHERTARHALLIMLIAAALAVAAFSLLVSWFLQAAESPRAASPRPGLRGK
jgi:hypothetical protein